MITPPLSVYLHFPWCVAKCPYCDFNSFGLSEPLPEARYVAALQADIAAQAPALAGRSVQSVFLGGGTPSLFPPAAIGRVLSFLNAQLPLAPDAEVTLEANPATVERGRFAEYRDAGVTRVSLGAQSFDPEILKLLGRIHVPADVYRSAEELHAAGLANFNLDLMFALPTQDQAGALSDLREALRLEPAHVSHYQLTLEPGTLFAARPPAELPDEDLAWAMQEDCHAELAARGYAQYEVSAFAREGRQCRHNLNYWGFGDYLGAGAGAHGKLSWPAEGRIERTTHQREPRRYQADPLASLARRDVPPRELPFEFALNALRLRAGFALADYEARTGLAAEELSPRLSALAARGLLESRAGAWRATDTGFAFLNDVVASFLDGEKSQAGTGA